MHEAANRRALAGEPVAYEWSVDTPDGLTHYLTSLSPLYAADGQVNGIVGVSRDVAEIKQAQQRLQETERRMATLLGNLPGMAYRSHNDPDWTMELVSEGCGRLTGYTAEDLIGNRRLSYGDLIHPDDRGRVYDDIQRAVTRRKAFRLEYRIMTAVGQERWVWEQGSPVLDESGRVVALEGFVTDITDRIEAEEALRVSEARYRSIFRIAASLMISVDREGIIRDCNERSCDLLGYAPDVLIGRSVGTVIHPDDLRESRQVLGRILAEGMVLNHEMCLIHKDGHTIIASASCSAFADGQDEGIYAICIIDDLTERKRLEEQLRQAHKMEAVGRLAGTIAHDFNNLLMVINGYGQMIYDDMAPDDPARHEMAEMLAAGKRATSLTGQLLVFSRKNRAEIKVIALNDVLEGVARMLERLLGEDVRLDLALAEDLAPVRTDPRHMEQVIMNLAANARDAMPTGGAFIIETANVQLDEVQAAQHVGLDPGRYVMLTVSDTGTGIEPDVLAHLFEPFFTTKGEGSGTGLGLSTVYAIVKESQGEIYVYSERDKGTTFRIYLPAVQESVSRQVAASSTSLPRGDETILVIEDQDQVRRLVVRVLGQLGYHVLAAGNADEAEEICRATDDLRLVLADVVMPDVSGPQIVARLREMRPQLRIVYMSGYTEQTISRHMTLTPDTPLVQKPFTVEHLHRQVRRALDAAD